MAATVKACCACRPDSLSVFRALMAFSPSEAGATSPFLLHTAVGAWASAGTQGVGSSGGVGMHWSPLKTLHVKVGGRARA